MQLFKGHFTVLVFQKVLCLIITLHFLDSNIPTALVYAKYFTTRTLGLMYYVRYVCLFVYSGVQHILCCVRIVCTMLPVSLDCLFLIAPSVFSNVYLRSSL